MFAIGIVLYHARPLLRQDLFVCGYIGVEFFFIVSGYLLMKKADGMPRDEKRDVFDENLEMICHKAAGILPYFVPALVCAFVFRFLFSGKSFWDMTHDFIYGLNELFSLQMFGFETGNLIDVTWYLSALFIVSFVLFPILRKRAKGFVTYGAPLLVLFLYGYFSKTLNGAVNMPVHWYGICFKGLLRGFAGISLGCIAYFVSKKLSEHDISRKQRAVLTIAELSGYLIAVVYLIFYPTQGTTDYFIIGLIFSSVVISFSGQSASGVLFHGRICSFLGAFSLSLFLNHSYVQWNMKRIFGSLVPKGESLIPLYLGLVLILSIGNYFIGNWIKRKRYHN